MEETTVPDARWSAKILRRKLDVIAAFSRAAAYGLQKPVLALPYTDALCALRLMEYILERMKPEELRTYAARAAQLRKVHDRIKRRAFNEAELQEDPAFLGLPSGGLASVHETLRQGLLDTQDDQRLRAAAYVDLMRRIQEIVLFIQAVRGGPRLRLVSNSEGSAKEDPRPLHFDRGHLRVVR